MKTKREYEEAFDLIDIFTSCGCNEVDDCNCCIAYDKRLKQQHGCELDLALNMFKELIDEHFEPKENTSEFKHFKLLYHNWGACDEQLKRVIDKAKELSDSNDELRRQLYFIEPYKFEDLKPNMWVYDGIEKLICQIGLISKNAIHREYVDGTISDSPFEEKRFFPVQCANLES